MGSCCSAALELLGVDFCWAGWIPGCDLKGFFLYMVRLQHEVL